MWVMAEATAELAAKEAPAWPGEVEVLEVIPVTEAMEPTV
jgi:hypothetical protein